MKRYIAVLLALVCLLTPLANTKGVFAVTYSTAEYEDIISTLMGEASTFEENFNNVQEQQGIYTQLYQARQIFGYATCVYGAAYSAQKDDAYRKQIGGSLGMLAVTLSDMIVSYNASYFVSEGEYKGEAFSQCSGETSVLKNLEAASDDAIQKACEVLEEWCIAVAKTYLVQTVEKYADDVELDNEDMQEENSSLCSEIYKALKYGLTCISDVESVLGQQNEQTLSLKGYTFKKSTVEERIKADIEKYAELFGTGLINVAIDDESDNIISIDPDKSILENMADVQVDDDGVISIEEDPQLSLAYFGILASGATYTPFESYVGDNRFMEALDSLCADQETVALLNSYYNSLKLYKKPLYYRSLNAVGNPEGQAELKTISEIFDLITSGASGALCTMNGNLCVNTNTGDWVYSTEQLDSSLLYSLKSAMPSAVQTDDDDDASLGNYVGTGSNANVTINEVSKNLYAALHDKGMSDVAICGILGNIQQESGFNPSAANGTSYYGLAQWGSGFKDLYNNWSSKYKGDADAQIKYLVSSLYEGGYKDVPDKLATATTPTEACDIFCAEYERCITDKQESPNKEYEGKWYQHLELREEYAESFYTNLAELQDTTTASLGERFVDLLSDWGIVDKAYASTLNVENATDPDDIDLDNGSTTTSLPEFENGSSSTEEEGKTYSSADKVLTSYTDSTVDFQDAISAARVISDESRMNGPALMFGSIYQRDIDNMTTAIYSNVLRGAGDYNVQNMDSEYLYINAFGDIVTASDLVVFPGILNPLLYADGVSYNPYTVAFMNSYPANIRNSAYYMLSSKSDIGKYCLFLDTTEANEASVISGYNENENDNFILTDGDYEFALLTSTTGVKSTQTLLSKQIYNKFIYGDFEKANTYRLQKYLFTQNLSRKTDLSTYIPMIPSASIYADGKQVFPYDLTADTDGKISSVIANNMYQYLTTDFVTKEIGNCGKLWDNWILHYILISGSEGTADISSYKNNLDISYDGYTQSNTSRAIQQITAFSERLVESLSDATGVLGLQNSYEDVLLGKIVTVIRNYWLIFLIVFLFVVLIAVMKARKDLLQSAFLIVACTGAAYAFVYFVPVYLPMFYNVAVNNLSDKVAYEIMVHNDEYNAGTADNIVDVDSEGHLKYNTGSLTLYRIPSAQLESHYDSLGITLNDTTGGSSYVFDQYGGFFLEGDSLKVSTDVLFGTLSIKEDQSSGTLHAYKTVSNNVDYYIPYYQIVDSLVDRFNRITEVYDVCHSTTKLKNGARVDNYRAYTYFNSPVFINPANIQEDLSMDITGWSEDEISEYVSKQQKINDALLQKFGENEDWLGMYDILVTDALKSGSNLQNTLWFKTMCDVGYYRGTENGWVVDEENMGALIEYINYQTRNFVYDLKDYIGDVSDETIIEIVALRAVVALTQEASDFTHWMYPFSMNYAEFSLGDVATSTFVENYSDYVKSNYSIVQYVIEKYGWFNAIIFDAVIILMFAVAWLVRILSAAFYVLLLIILLIRMFGDGRYFTVVKGFLKCSAVIMTILLLQVSGVAVGSKLVGKVVGIYAVLGINVLSVYLLVILITSILFNFTEFGNTALTAKVTGITNSLQKFKNISVDTTSLRRSRPQRNPALVTPTERMSKYAFDADIDDQYDMTITDIEPSVPEKEEGVLEFDTEEEIDTTEYEF